MEQGSSTPSIGQMSIVVHVYLARSDDRPSLWAYAYRLVSRARGSRQLCYANIARHHRWHRRYDERTWP